jgi:hypothetical protein
LFGTNIEELAAICGTKNKSQNAEEDERVTKFLTLDRFIIKINDIEVLYWKTESI